jgi:putative ABC transport system permease protein
MKTRTKETLRLIRQSRGRFLTLSAIVLIGSSFFTGVSSSSERMAGSVDVYLDETRLADLTLYSDYGFDAEDVEHIAGVEGVEAVQGRRFVDVLAEDGQQIRTARVTGWSMDQDLDQLELVEGRWPENEHEALGEAGTSAKEGAVLGSEITLTRPEDDLDDYLKVDTVTIVGLVRSPEFLNATMGSSTLKGRQLDTFYYVPESAFSISYYTSIDVLTAEGSSYNTFSDAYHDYILTIKEEVEDVQSEVGTHRRQEIRQEAEEEYADGVNEYLDGLHTLQDEIAQAEEEISAHEQEIADGWQEIADAEAKLNDSQAELNQARLEGEQSIQSARDQIEAGRRKLAAGQQTLDAKKEEAEAALSQLADLSTSLSTVQTALTAVEGLESGIAYEQSQNPSAALVGDLSSTMQAQILSYFQAQLPQMSVETVSGLLSVDPAGNGALLAALNGYDSNALISSLPQDTQDAVMAALTSTLPSVPVSLVETMLAGTRNAIFQQLDGQRSALTEAGLTVPDSADALTASLVSEWISGLESRQASIRSQLSQAQAEIDAGKSQLDKAYEETVNGSVELEEKIAEGQKEIDEGWQEIAENKAALNDAEAELEEGRQELEEERAEGLQELADARQELLDARQDILDLSEEEWTVLDRRSFYGVETYRQAVQQMASIASLFPMFFVMVAALVCMTTMTRMVDENRGQLGILRALGYTPFQCMQDYLAYASAAGLIGTVLGVILGQYTFPIIIYTAWGMAYHEPAYVNAVPWNYILLSLVIFPGVLILTTLKVAGSELKEQPAQLMRPKAPAAGKTTWIEKIPWLWNRLSFSWKITMRNLLRYKKRSILTVLGITGCTALLLTGFGVRSSIATMVEKQYGELTHYDGLVTLKNSSWMTYEETALKSQENVSGLIPVCAYGSDVTANGEEDSLEVFVFNEQADFEQAFTLRTRRGHHALTLPEEGVILSEKTAENLGVVTGDSITLETEDGQTYQAEVAGICESYLQQMAVFSASGYAAASGEEADFKTLLIQTSDGETSSLRQMLGSDSHVDTMSFNTETRKSYDSMVDSLVYIVVVIILCAMALTFVVEGNLTRINIAERQREIATFKVLGFRPREVQDYIYHENNVLAVLGALLGLAAGTGLHHWIMGQVEMKDVMFGRTIPFLDYLLAFVLTLVFAWIVNLSMRPRLRQVDMIESLKSVE